MNSYNARQILSSSDFFNLYWNYKIPVDLDIIAKNMNIHVRYVEHIEGDSVEYQLTGRIDNINGLVICSINSTKSSFIQRFTLAHLLGHYICNHGFGFKCNVKSFDKNTLDKRDNEANLVAINILMPEIAVNHLIQKENITDIEELAKWFDVSKIIVKERLKQLNWL